MEQQPTHMVTTRGFVGRSAELRSLAGIADKVTTGSPQVVWIRGRAGIGKTSLVRAFVAGLTDFTVLWAAADPSETLADYGVVDQLVRRLPADVRGATPLLAGAVGSDANPLAVGAQLLELLGTLQSRGSVVIVVDDVQWADASSISALGFLLRRIWIDQVLVVFVARPIQDLESGQLIERLTHSAPDASTIDLAGLSSPEAAGLSRLVTGDELPTWAVERLRDYTAGHPLLLRKLLTDLPVAELVDHARPLTAPRSVVTAVNVDMRQLPVATRDLLAALAVLGTRSPLARVVRISGVERPTEALQPALEAELVDWWPDDPICPIALAHDLQREGIYRALTPARRRELHARAAAVVDQGTAWAHRVAASTSTDSRLAAELEQAAAAVAEAGRHSVAAAYLRWAADLSATQAEYERRLLTSGVHAMFSSDRGEVARVHARSLNITPSALRSLFLGLAALLIDGHWSAARQLFVEAVTQSDSTATEQWVRGTARAGLAAAQVWGGDDAEAERAARAALATGGLPTLLSDYTRVLLAVATSRIHGMIRGRATFADLPANPSLVPTVNLDALTCRGAMDTMLGRFAAAKRDLAYVVDRHRAGAFLLGGSTPYAYLAASHYQLGEWDDAAIVVQQALASAADGEEQPQNRTLRRLVASLVPSGRGDWETAREHVRLAHQFAQQVDSAQDLRYAALAQAIMQHARGDDPSSMLTTLRAVPGLSDEKAGSGMHNWWSLWLRPLLIEALLRTRAVQSAGRHLARLQLAAVDAPYLAPTVQRLSAALTDQLGDRRSALTAVSTYLTQRSSGTPLAEGLLEHEHGRRLLADHRRGEAIEWLRSAKSRFADLGAVPYGRRVEHDLASCGVREAGSTTRLSALTGREAEVVHLVERQLTNREIGAQLFVTAKTVEYHLGNIYGKLGVTSRRELRRLLAQPRDPPPGI
jgi:DNA-binding CsgD family transcriptional regulator